KDGVTDRLASDVGGAGQGVEVALQRSEECGDGGSGPGLGEGGWNEAEGQADGGAGEEQAGVGKPGYHGPGSRRRAEAAATSMGARFARKPSMPLFHSSTLTPPSKQSKSCLSTGSARSGTSDGCNHSAFPSLPLTASPEKAKRQAAKTARHLQG